MGGEKYQGSASSRNTKACSDDLIVVIMFRKLMNTVCKSSDDTVFEATAFHLHLIAALVRTTINYQTQ